MRHCSRIFALLLLLTACAIPPVWAQQTATVTGAVTDADTGEPLPGASIVLSRAASSAVVTSAPTDANGGYTITGLAPGAYVLSASFLGYGTVQQDIQLAGGQTLSVPFSLSAGGIGIAELVVSASRQTEKILDAPASVSVLGSAEIQESNNGLSSAAALRNTPGLDYAQTGVDRREMVLRGFNNAFSGATYVMTDYRQAAVPSLGVNVFSLMPAAALDLERVEVVRGPGSALYGAGVDAGVIHFITKDPFTYPGTAISVAGGERSAFTGDLRHAGVISGKLGYKITGSYARANDWELNPGDSLDQAQLASDAVARDYDYDKFNGNLMLQYRFSPGVSLTATGGYSSIDATVLSGIGTLQAKGFGYTYGQLRLQAGNFFAQTYVNRNDAGDSFVYGTNDKVVDNSLQYVAQAQYNLDLWAGRQQFVFGADADLTNPQTEGTILGRNEDEDIQQFGGYVQSTTHVSPAVDITLAGRADYDNIVDDVRLSPRAAVVYKITPEHSVRATYNYAFSSPGTNSLFLDIIAGTLPGTTIDLRGRGSAYGFTYERNPAFTGIAGTDLVASSLNPDPNALGAPTPAGLPLDLTYGQVYASLAAIPSAQLAAILSQQLQRNISAGDVDFLKEQLQPLNTQVQGFSKGQLMLLNPTTRAFEPISGISDVAPLKQTTSQTLELGYKGLFNDRMLFTADLYYTDKRNFVGPLAVETPFVFVPSLAPDLAAAIAAGIGGNAQLSGALAQMGLTPEQIAGLIAGMAQQNAAFPDKPGTAADLPVAIVQPNENNPGVGQTPEVLLSYRNFGRVQYYGADIAAQFMATDRLDVFGNLSWVSDNFFDNEELDESGTDLSVALNAPSMKAKGGFNYAIPRGFSFGAAGRYTEGFPVRSGPYVGDVQDYFLLDLMAGYDFGRYAPGLRAGLSVQNVLDDKHREFVGAPKIGRLALLRLTYSM